MTGTDRQRQEVVAILMAAVSGEASEEDLDRVSRLIISNEEWAGFVLNVMCQEAWLTWHGSKTRSPSDHSTVQLERLLFTAGVNGNGAYQPKATCATEVSITSRRDLQSKSVARASRSIIWGSYSKLRNIGASGAVAAALLIGIGALAGSLGRWFGESQGPIVVNELGAGVQLPDEVPRNGSTYRAQVVRATACVWAPDIRSRIDSHDPLRSGESINLIAGLAELQLNWPMRGNATLRLEGPAGLVLMADGSANLNYGRVAADVYLEFDTFTVETPIGRVMVRNNAKFGVAVSSPNVEIHVFNGEVELAPLWNSGLQSVDGLKVRAGRSVSLRATDSGAISVARGPALPGRFTSQVPMGSDLLEIPHEYVEAVEQARPLIYWRFDPPVDGQVKNVMGEHYNAVVVGKPSWVEERGNGSVEFGTGLDADELHALLVTDEPLKKVEAESYTIELWAKPSHFHLGSMIALVKPTSATEPDFGRHGALLELGGPRALYSSLEHPGRVRFLHRDPPEHNGAIGTSCFSDRPYVLRKWQHLVAVKDKTDMRLYVDAKLMASEKNSSPLSGDLELVVGQIDRRRDWRPFVGQLDEMAFYDRTLSETEIEQHYRLVRPKISEKPELSANKD
jgi:hypothetical protein